MREQQGRGVARPILAEAGHKSVKRERIIADINREFWVLNTNVYDGESDCTHHHLASTD